MPVHLCSSANTDHQGHILCGCERHLPLGGFSSADAFDSLSHGSFISHFRVGNELPHNRSPRIVMQESVVVLGGNYAELGKPANEKNSKDQRMDIDYKPIFSDSCLDSFSKVKN